MKYNDDYIIEVKYKVNLFDVKEPVKDQDYMHNFTCEQS